MDDGRFKKGNKPWNTGRRKKLDLDDIKKLHWNKELSILDISKKLGCSDRLIRLRMKENNISIRPKTEITERQKQKISKTNKEKGIQPKERYSGEPWNKGLTIEDLRVKNNIRGLLENRKTQVLPKKDTSIEIKIQNFLKQLGIEFYTHQYMKIEHGYQCDVLIPVQEGIEQKTIIECFGDYWHNYPYAREVDNQRINDLRKNGWRVLVFWECEIKPMNINIFEDKLIQ